MKIQWLVANVIALGSPDIEGGSLQGGRHQPLCLPPFVRGREVSADDEPVPVLRHHHLKRNTAGANGPFIFRTKEGFFTDCQRNAATVFPARRGHSYGEPLEAPGSKFSLRYLRLQQNRDVHLRFPQSMHRRIQPLLLERWSCKCAAAGVPSPTRPPSRPSGSRHRRRGESPAATNPPTRTDTLPTSPAAPRSGAGGIVISLTGGCSTGALGHGAAWWIHVVQFYPLEPCYFHTDVWLFIE